MIRAMAFSLDLEANLHDLDFACIGRVTAEQELHCRKQDRSLFRLPLQKLLHAFKHPLDLDGSLTGDES